MPPWDHFPFTSLEPPPYPTSFPLFFFFELPNPLFRCPPRAQWPPFLFYQEQSQSPLSFSTRGSLVRCSARLRHDFPPTPPQSPFVWGLVRLKRNLTSTPQGPPRLRPYLYDQTPGISLLSLSRVGGPSFTGWPLSQPSFLCTPLVLFPPPFQFHRCLFFCWDAAFEFGLLSLWGCPFLPSPANNPFPPPPPVKW